jgi:hypothetical protein
MKINNITAALGILFLLSQLSACTKNESQNIDPLGRGEGETCGGLLGSICEEGLFCKLTAGLCGVYNRSGDCTRVPEVCTDVYDPVCGCNGKTYPNECEADAQMVSIDYKAECR